MPETTHGRCGYVGLVGRPNVGKSTLLNRLLGQKLAITSHKPQTTRHSILGVKTVPGGQLVYLDTPGIHERGKQAMNRYLNRTARAALADVDVAVFLVEAGRWTREDELVLESLVRRELPVMLAVNKVDRIKPKERLLPYLQEVAQRGDFVDVIPISARNGDQLDVLETEVLRRLPRGPNFFEDDQLTDRSERFFAAELLREQLTRRYSKELPYALTVEIERFEAEGNLYRIAALVWVEREGQKNILIGAQGAAMKGAAREARLEMERFFGKRVYLDVWIKVKKSWSNDESALARLGYGDAPG